MAVAVERMEGTFSLASLARERCIKAGPGANPLTIARQLRAEIVKHRWYSMIDELAHYYLMTQQADIFRRTSRAHETLRNGGEMMAGVTFGELLGKDEDEPINEAEVRQLSMGQRVCISRGRYKTWGEFTVRDLQDRAEHLGGILRGYRRSIATCLWAIQAIQSVGVTTLGEALGSPTSSATPKTAPKTKRPARVK